MFGFLEPLGRSLYEGATTILPPPYLISILFGIIGVCFIVYEYICRNEGLMITKNGDFFYPMRPTDYQQMN